MTLPVDDPIAGLRAEVAALQAERDIALAEKAALASQLAHRNDTYAEHKVHQAATNEVLSAMAASPADPQPVFDLIATRARDICGSYGVSVMEFDGVMVHLRAWTGVSDDPAVRNAYVAQFPRQPDPTRAEGRAILDGQVVHVRDYRNERELRLSPGSVTVRSNVAVLMKRGTEVIGVVTMGSREVGGFSDSQVELLETFAEQAVIAITSAEAHRAQRETLEQQTATADILRVISQSPTDVTPVLNAVARAAVRFCGAEDSTISLKEGADLTLAAHEGPIASDEVGRRYPLDGATMRGQAIIDGRTIHLPDAAGPEGARYGRTQELARRLGFHAVVAAPMLRENEAIGSIALRKSQLGAFTRRQIELLETFAAQAVIAIENVRLFTELREALEQQTATAEILRAISQSPTDVGPVLAAVAKAALKFCGAGDALVVLREGDYWFVAAHEGPIATPDGARPLTPYTPPGRAIRDGKIVQVGDLQSPEGDDFPEARQLGARLGFRSALAAPLLRDHVAIGAIALRRPEPGAFTSNQIELLETFAAQAVIAIENVRLFTELRDSLERLKAAQANLIQAEKMASLGQLAAGIAHEIKNPLNFVNNFSGLSVELLDELKEAAAPVLMGLNEGARAEFVEAVELLTSNLNKIAEHGKRADGIVKSMLSHSRGGTGDWQKSNINTLAEEAVNLAYHGARAQDQGFNVTLERDFGEMLKPIEVVPQDITRVFLNLIGNGFYAVRKRQRESGEEHYRATLLVATRDLGEAVEVRVRDNGTGVTPELREKLFQPFFTTKPTGEGTGLGLSISYDIVTQQHGGTIEVASEPGQFTEFTVRLPRARRIAEARGAQ